MKSRTKKSSYEGAIMRRIIIKMEQNKVVVSINGKESEYKKCKGLVNLIELMAYPDAEISCLTLATDDIPKAWETEKRMLKARMVYDSETAGVDTYHSLQSYEDDEIMDIKYLNSLKKEAKRLIEQIAIAEEWNDLARIDVLKEELEQVTTYLSKHTQTNGKSRKLPNEFTKPKEAVKKSINRAINIIGQQDEELIIHLKQQIRIGKTCCYRSLPSVDVTVMRF